MRMACLAYLLAPDIQPFLDGWETDVCHTRQHCATIEQSTVLGPPIGMFVIPVFGYDMMVVLRQLPWNGGRPTPAAPSTLSDAIVRNSPRSSRLPIPDWSTSAIGVRPFMPLTNNTDRPLSLSAAH